MVKKSPRYRRNPIVTLDASFERVLGSYGKTPSAFAIVLLFGKGKRGAWFPDRSTPLYLDKKIDPKKIADAWLEANNPKLGEIKVITAPLVGNAGKVKVVLAYVLEKQWKPPHTDLTSPTLGDLMLNLTEMRGAKAFFLSTKGLVSEDIGNIQTKAEMFFANDPNKTFILSTPPPFIEKAEIVQKDAALAKRKETMYLQSIKKAGRYDTRLKKFVESPLYISQSVGNPFTSFNSALIVLYYRPPLVQGDPNQSRYDPAFHAAQKFFGYEAFWKLIDFWMDPEGNNKIGPEASKWRYNEIITWQPRANTPKMDIIVETDDPALDGQYLDQAEPGSRIEISLTAGTPPKIVYIVLDPIEDFEDATSDPDGYQEEVENATDLIVERALDSYQGYSLYFIKGNLERMAIYGRMQKYWNILTNSATLPIYVVGLKGSLMPDGSPLVLADAPVTLGVNYKTDLGSLTLVTMGKTEEDIFSKAAYKERNHYTDLTTMVLTLKKRMLTEGGVARPIVILQVIDDCVEGWKPTLYRPTKKDKNKKAKELPLLPAHKGEISTQGYFPYTTMGKGKKTGKAPTTDQLKWIYRLVPISRIYDYVQIGQHYVHGKEVKGEPFKTKGDKDDLIRRITSSDLYLDMNAWRNTSVVSLRSLLGAKQSWEKTLAETKREIREVEQQIEAIKRSSRTARDKAKEVKDVKVRLDFLKKSAVALEEQTKALDRKLKVLRRKEDLTVLSLGNYFSAPLLDLEAPRIRGAKPLNMRVVSLVARDCGKPREEFVHRGKRYKQGEHPVDAQSLDTAIQKYGTELAIRTGPIIIFDAPSSGVTAENWPRIKTALEGLAYVSSEVYAINVPNAIPKPEVELPPDYRSTASGLLATTSQRVKVSERTQPVQWIVFIGKGDESKKMFLYKKNSGSIQWWQDPRFEGKVDEGDFRELERIFPGGQNMKNMILNGFVNNAEWARRHGFSTLKEWSEFMQSQALSAAARQVRAYKEAPTAKGERSRYEEKRQKSVEARLAVGDWFKPLNKAYAVLQSATDRLFRAIATSRYQRLDLLMSLMGIPPSRDAAIQRTLFGEQEAGDIEYYPQMTPTAYTLPGGGTGYAVGLHQKETLQQVEVSDEVISAQHEVGRVLERMGIGYGPMRSSVGLPVRKAAYEIQLQYNVDLKGSLVDLKKRLPSPDFIQRGTGKGKSFQPTSQEPRDPQEAIDLRALQAPLYEALRYVDENLAGITTGLENVEKLISQQSADVRRSAQEKGSFSCKQRSSQRRDAYALCLCDL